MLSEQIQRWSEQLGIEWMMPGLSDSEKAAALLLLFIHKGFNDSVWSSKRRRYWGAFEENVALCLGAEHLPSFASQFAENMSARIGRNALQRQIAVEITWCEDAGEIFRCIRESAKMLIVLVQVIRDAIKAQYDLPDEEDEAEGIMP